MITAMSGVQGVALAVSVVLVGASAMHARSRVPAVSPHPLSTRYTRGLACDDADLPALQSQLDALEREIAAHFHYRHGPYFLPDDVATTLSAQAAELRGFVNGCVYGDDR